MDFQALITANERLDVRIAWLNNWMDNYPDRNDFNMYDTLCVELCVKRDQNSRILSENPDSPLFAGWTISL